jgi:3',5'-cyclic-AMP phosphodiesterase
MLPRTLVHLSDIHIGRSLLDEQRAANLVQRLVSTGVDQVVVTGDLTNKGRKQELERFREIFLPLERAGRLTLVPGNHDRLGHDVSSEIQAGPRVQTRTVDGLHLIRFDSSGPHNRAWLSGHGMMTTKDVKDITAAVMEAPDNHLVVLMLHHHPLPLPEDTRAELLSSWLGWKYTAELELGWTMLRSIAGRCDLVLHGHRHIPRAFKLFEDTARPMSLFNAGSTTELDAARLFSFVNGRLLGEPLWLGNVADSKPQRPTAKRPLPPRAQVAIPAWAPA